MNLKKIMVAGLAGVCLAGCSTSGSATGNILPVPNSASLADLMPEETYKMMTGVYGKQFINLAGMLNYVGADTTDLTFTTMDGSKLKTEDLKGQKVVYEIVANWCEYCQQEGRDYIDNIYAANEDVTFVQIFAEGNPDEVNEFYSTIGKEMNADYTIPATTSLEDGAAVDKNITEFIERTGTASYPTFVFVDEDGKVSWTYAGLIEDSQFSFLTDAAFAETKIYETFTDETLDTDALNRTIKDVENELSEEAKELIETVESNDSNLEVLYANLNREFFTTTFTDIEGETLDLEELKGKNFIFEILTADETNYTGSKTSAENLAKYKDSAYTYIQFWLPSEDVQTAEQMKDYLEENDIYGEADYVIPLTEENNVDELMDIDVYNFPTQFFIDKDYRVAGVTQGAMTKTKFEAATKAFFGRTPLYKMAKTTTDDSEE